MSDGTDDTTIGRGGWALVTVSGVVSFVVLYFLMNYPLFPSVTFSLAIALIVLLILHRLAVAVNRHDDAENERQVRKIVPAASVGDEAIRVGAAEGAQRVGVVAVPVRPDPSAASLLRPAAVVTPLSRVESAPIIAPQPVTATPAAPVPPEPPEADAEPADSFADLPDVWTRRERTSAPATEPVVAPEPTPVPPVAAASKPKSGFKTKAELAAAAAAKGQAADITPESKAKAATKTKGAAKVKAEANPKAEPTAEAKPKAQTKTAAKAATKPKAAKAAKSGPERLSAPRGGVADDLKEIEGIGPAIEKLVNGLGFYHFDQVAAWTEEDVAKVDAELRTFKGRIARDKWVAQARIIVNEGLMAFRERAKTNDY
jgi:predicted flap endonuclease-1-like 5' DNA nuclease